MVQNTKSTIFVRMFPRIKFFKTLLIFTVKEIHTKTFLQKFYFNSTYRAFTKCMSLKKFKSE